MGGASIKLKVLRFKFKEEERPRINAEGAEVTENAEKRKAKLGRGKTAALDRKNPP